MCLKNTIFAAILLFLLSENLVGQDIIPVNEIEPGMRGFGKTVFTGSKIEQFEFEVIDIMPNFKAKRDLILVKLIGEKVEYTGVVAGMSGSPMYIDGKLIGALSYRFGLFQKDPIAGVTPVEQMFEIFGHEKVRQEELASNRGFNPLYFETAVGAREFKLENFIPLALRKSKAQKGISALVPLQIPLIFSGFEETVLDLAFELFRAPGLAVQSGGASSSTEGFDIGPLEPGSAYSVVIVDGDIGIHATGTVTFRDEKRVVGMGHPVFYSGAVDLPMAKVKILTTLSSLMASTKMSSLTEIIGTIHQDRTTGVMGVTGEEPKMIPIELRFKPAFQDEIEYKFRIAEDRSLHSITPLIFSIVIANSLESARMSFSKQTLKVDGRINLKDHKPILIQNFYAGKTSRGSINDAIEATGEISAILGALLSNNFEPPKIESVQLDFIALHKRQLANVERIEVDRTFVKPGDTIELSVYLQEFQGEQHRIKHNLTIPEDISAKRIAIYAGGGATLSQLEFRSSPQRFKPKNFNHLLSLLNNRRKNNYLFFQIRLRAQGVLVEGKQLPGLPPSILTVMNSQKSTGNIVNLRDRTLLEENVEVNFSVSGGRTIWLNVIPKK